MPQTYIVAGRAASSGISRSPRARPQNHQNLRRCSYFCPTRTCLPNCVLSGVMVSVGVSPQHCSDTENLPQQVSTTRETRNLVLWSRPQMYAASDKSFAITEPDDEPLSLAI